MERHVVEILVILVRRYPEGAINPDEFEPLTKDLIDRGYTQNEIETALFWYHSRQGVEIPKRTAGITPGAIRILHEVERAIITPKAFGYLLELYHLGLISIDELDSVIERAVLLGGRRVDIEDMKLFVATQIMEKEIGLGTSEQSFYMKTPPDRIQ